MFKLELDSIISSIENEYFSNIDFGATMDLETLGNHGKVNKLLRGDCLEFVENRSLDSLIYVIPTLQIESCLSI